MQKEMKVKMGLWKEREGTALRNVRISSGQAALTVICLCTHTLKKLARD